MLNQNSQRGNPSQASAEELKVFQERHSIAQEYVLSIIDDVQKILPPNVYSLADSLLDKNTVKTRFQAEGLAFATLTLPKLSAGLFLYFETGRVCYPSFQLKKGTGHPVFLSGLFRLAYRVGEWQVEAIRAIYQISVIFKKLKGPYPVSVLRKQLADFVQADSELESIDWFSESRIDILEQARAEVRQLFAGFNLDNAMVKPKPGPGATNDPVAKHLRFRPHVLYTQIDKVMPYVDFFNVHMWDVVGQTALYQRLYKRAVKAPRARFKFVHKVVGKARGICIEQNEMQYMQQAIKRALYDWIQKHPLTRGKINFDDQSRNAELALLASLDRLMATIDMSEASDRVARELVSWLFQDTVIHDVLMGLSTKWIDLPKGLGDQPAIKTSKYAPMGSGLCFPVMSVVHWALVRAIIACSMHDDAHMKEVYVYGDDIIIPAEVTEAVYDYLPQFGMKVNTTKSYYRSYFRESCGVHAYNGVDITPIFIKNLPVSSSFQATMSCIDSEYQFEKAGYLGVANLLRTGIRKAFTGYQFPYVHVTSPIFGFKRDGVTTPSYPGKVNRRFDSWGNPVLKARVVSPKLDQDVPPSELESYLRHVLTSDVKREVSGNLREFILEWKVVPIPGTVLKETEMVRYLKDHYPNQDARCLRDITQERGYEFPKSCYRTTTRFAERLSHHGNTRNKLRDGVRYDLNHISFAFHKLWGSRSDVSTVQTGPCRLQRRIALC